MPTLLRAAVHLCVCASFATHSTPYEVNIAALEKQRRAERARAEGMQGSNLHTEPSLYSINNRAPRRTA